MSSEYKQMQVNLNTEFTTSQYSNPEDAVSSAKQNSNLDPNPVNNSLKFTVSFEREGFNNQFRPTKIYTTNWGPSIQTSNQDYPVSENVDSNPVLQNSGYNWEDDDGFNIYTNTVEGDGVITFNYDLSYWKTNSGTLSNGSQLLNLEAENVDSFKTGETRPYWIATGDGGGWGSILNSSDGKSWVQINQGACFSSVGNSVAYGTSNGTDTLWVAGGIDFNNFENNLLWSSDGKTWNPSDALGEKFESEASDVAYGRSNDNEILWVAVGNGTGSVGNIMWSEDGKTWNNSSSSGDTFENQGIGVAYGTSNGTSPLWVAVGDDTDSYGNIMWSEDGKIWNNSDSSGTSFQNFGNDVAYGTSDGTSPLWVAVGDDTDSYGNIMWSEDGKTWNKSDSSGNGFQNQGIGVAYGTSNGTSPLWVAVGDNDGINSGNIMWSEDGKIWNNSDSSGDIFFVAKGVAYGTSIDGTPLWVAVGEGLGFQQSDHIKWSTNGKTWNNSDSSGSSFYIEGLGVAFNQLLYGMKPKNNNFPSPIDDAYVSVFSPNRDTNYAVNFSYGGYQLVSSNNSSSNTYYYALETSIGSYTGYKTEFSSSTYNFTDQGGPNCVDQNTKILCLDEENNEVQIPVKNLRPGNIVKTYKQGYKKINKIAYETGFNNYTDPSKNSTRMVLRKTKENGLLEDLYVTSRHLILVDNLTELQEKQEKYTFLKLYNVLDKKLVQARHHPDFEIVEKPGYYCYYQMTLENDGNVHARHGIYTNNYLTETTCLHDFETHLKNMIRIN